MSITPANPYPCAYAESLPEIEFVCACHSGQICGRAGRTGLTADEAWPVYALRSFLHPEFDALRVALTTQGLVLLPVYTIVEHEPRPSVTPFTARMLTDGKAAWDYDPHPETWWMYTRGDLVQAVNRHA